MSSNDCYLYSCLDRLETLNIEKIKSSFETNKLIGFTEYTEQEFEDMLDYLTCLISEDVRELKSNRKISFVVLVELAKRWKSIENEADGDVGFWEYVANRLHAEENCQSVQSIRNSFVQAINSLELHGEIVTVKTGHRFYATVLMHSFAPFNSMQSFFELCFNIFKKDLDYSYTKDDKWICESIAVKICNILSQGYSEENGVSIGSEIYFFGIGLKSFALHELLFEDFVDFVDKVLTAIHEMYFNQTFCQTDWVDSLLQNWWNCRRIQDEEGRVRRCNPIVSKQDVIADYVKKDDNQVYLRIPAIRVEENDQIQVRISSNGKILLFEDLWKKRGLLFFSTKTKEYCLNDLCENWGGKIDLRVEILENDSVIFDSNKNKKTSLERDFILFINEKEVKGILQEPNNYFLFSADVDSLKTCPDDTSKVAKNMYCVYPKSGESITGEIRQVSFVERQQMSQNRGQIRLVGYMDEAKWTIDGQNYSVFKDNVKLLIPDYYNLKSLELKINDKPYLLSTLEYEDEGDDKMFGLCRLGLVGDCSPLKISLYSYDYDKEILSDCIVTFPKLSIKFNLPYYYGSQQRKVFVSYDSKTIDDFEFDNTVEEIESPLFEGDLCVRVPLLQWRINKGEWNSRGIDGIQWYEDYIQREDELEIRCPNQNGIRLCLICDGVEREIQKVQDNRYFIGRTVCRLQKVKEARLSIIVGEGVFPIMSFSVIEGFVKSPFSYREGKVYWDVENTFVGRKTNSFFISYLNGKTKIGKKLQNVNCEIELPEGAYEIYVSKESDNLFIQNSKELGTFDLIVGDEEKYRFRGKKLKFLWFWDYDKVRHKFEREYYIDDLDGYYDEVEKQYYYLGTLCQRVGGELKTIEKLENGNGVKEITNPVRIDLRSNRTMWIQAGWKEDGDFIEDLFYDLTKKRLCINESNLPRYVQMLYIRFKEE